MGSARVSRSNERNRVILTMARRSVLRFLLVAQLFLPSLSTQLTLQLTMDVTIPSLADLGGNQCCVFSGATTAGDGRVFFQPMTSDYVGVFDPSTNAFSTIATTYADGTPFTLDWKFHGVPVNLRDGRVLFPPKQCDIGLLDPDTDTFITVKTGTSGCNNALQGAVLIDDGRVVITPYGGGQIVVFDPSTNTATAMNLPLSGNAFLLGAKAGDGRVVFPPNFSNQFGIFDPDTNTTEARTVDPMHTHNSLGYYRFIGAVTAGDGRVVFVPSQTLDVGVFNPWNDTFTTMRTPPMLCDDDAVECQAAWMVSGIQDPKGRVVLLSFRAHHILIFDHRTDSLHTVDVNNGFGGLSAALPDGRIVIPPGARDSVGIFDPSTDTFSTLGSGLPPTEFAAITATDDGRVVLVPYNGDGPIGVIGFEPCDASAPPQNGGVGTCGSNLPYGSSCAVECDDRYEATGLTTCSADGYVPASCVCSPHTAACCDAMNDMGLLQPTYCSSCY